MLTPINGSTYAGSPGVAWKPPPRHDLNDSPALAQISGIEQHLPGPAIDIAQANNLTHQTHALALLGRGHHQRLLYGVNHTLGIVRVDDERLGQLPRSAGECRKQQNTLLVVARGDKFFGDEIHAVVETGDDARVGGSEQFENLVRLIMPYDQEDRLI